MLGYAVNAVPITMAKSTHIHARNSQEMQLQVAYPFMGWGLTHQTETVIFQVEMVVYTDILSINNMW